MKTFTSVSRLATAVGLTAVLLSPAAMSAGKGWDTFNMGQGDGLAHAQRQGAAASGATAGKGWDAFAVGQGERIPAAGGAYEATSSVPSAGEGWDAFNMGQGERLPGGASTR